MIKVGMVIKVVKWVVGRIKGDRVVDSDGVREFKVCPYCGSRERFFEKLANELVEIGEAREGFKFYYRVTNGVVADEGAGREKLVGSEAIGFEVKEDICYGCGREYTVGLSNFRVKKAVAPKKIVVPKGFMPNDARKS